MTHPLRCETCSHYKLWTEVMRCEIIMGESPTSLQIGIPYHANIVGCASHSDAVSERERVLELLNDLRRYANGEYKEADLSDNEHDLRIHLEYENRIWGIMKELRQGEP